MAEANLRAICPIFQVSNLERGIEFYTRVMGFELSWTWGDPPDRASLCRDAVEIPRPQWRLHHEYRVNGQGFASSRGHDEPGHAERTFSRAYVGRARRLIASPARRRDKGHEN